MKRVVPAVVLVLLGVWISRFVPQTPHPNGYAERTRLAIEQTLGEVATAGLVLRNLQDETLPWAYASVTLRSSSASLATTAGSYAEVFPPSGSEDPATRTRALIGQAEDAVTATRLVVSRQDRGRLPAMMTELHDLTGRLQTLDDELEPAG